MPEFSEGIRLNGSLFKGNRLHARAAEKAVEAVSVGNEYEAALWLLLKRLTDHRDFIEVESSGSTGEPKQMELPKVALRHSAERSCDYFGLEAGHRALLCIPLNRIGGIMMVVRAMVRGLDLWYTHPRNRPLQRVEGDFDFAAMVPAQLHDEASSDVRQLDRISQLIVGGGAVPPALQDRLLSSTSTIYSTYGMTETFSHVAVARVNIPNGPAAFEALPGVRFETDESGRIRIHADHLHANGLQTNDLVELIDERHFRWLGRADNIINSGGVKLIPEQIEERISKLLPHPCLISWMPDERLGQQLVLLLESSLPPDADSIRTELEKVLDRYEMPKLIEHVPQFRYTQNGKIQRDESRKTWMALRGR